MSSITDGMCQPCHYCGSQPENQTYEFVYNGIDRVVQADGYVKDNVESFLNHISKIYTYNEEDLFF